MALNESLLKTLSKYLLVGAGATAAGAGAAGMAEAASKMSSKAKEQRLLEKTVQNYPELLKVPYNQLKKQYHILYNLSPTIGKDPITAGMYLNQITEHPFTPISTMAELARAQHDINQGNKANIIRDVMTPATLRASLSSLDLSPM